MKLRYYLRGLAAGLLIATIILSIANAGNRPLSDAQIRQRALELGMIEGDSMKLSSLQDVENTDSSGTYPESSPESSAKETFQSESSVPESSGSEKPVSESSVPESTVVESSSSGTSAPETFESADSGSESLPPVSGAGSEPVDIQPISFQIKNGASSYSVSKELAALGLVEDASVFDNFLCNNGYSKRIHAGTYEIYPGTSEEDIAKLIAR